MTTAAIKKLVDQHSAALKAAGYDMSGYEPYLEATNNLIQTVIQDCLQHVQPMPGSGDIDDLALRDARRDILSQFGLKE